MNKLKILLGFISVLVFSLTALGPGVASAAFNKDLVASDLVFNDYKTMNASQINSFLNSFPNSCISPNSGFSAKEPTGYNPNDGWLYGGFVSAGQVIYAAAQAYKLNPQVILSTLEKEQSLVTGRSSTSYCNNGNHKYAAAMGNNCPDSGGTYTWSGISVYKRNNTEVTSATTCVNTKAAVGFSQQVIRATWKLKFWQQRSLGNVDWAVIDGNWNNSDDLGLHYSHKMTEGMRKRCGSCDLLPYDGIYTIDGKSTKMGSGATAALYTYTPHFHGNELFVHFFEKWFGSTTGEIPYAIYRLYNSSTNNHLYTKSWNERNKAESKAGFEYEGVAFYRCTEEGGRPVYRLYNPNNGRHFFTVSEAERDKADKKTSYSYEGVAFYACGDTRVYRLYSAREQKHFYTKSTSERDKLVKETSFVYEGTAFTVN